MLHLCFLFSCWVLVGSHCNSLQKRRASELEMVGKDLHRNSFFYVTLSYMLDFGSHM